MKTSRQFAVIPTSKGRLLTVAVTATEADAWSVRTDGITAEESGRITELMGKIFPSTAARILLEGYIPGTDIPALAPAVAVAVWDSLTERAGSGHWIQGRLLENGRIAGSPCGDKTLDGLFGRLERKRRRHTARITSSAGRRLSLSHIIENT